MTKPTLHLIREIGGHASKLRRHEGFRVAAEAYEAATLTGAPDDLLEKLWEMVQREAQNAEHALAEGLR